MSPMLAVTTRGKIGLRGDLVSRLRSFRNFFAGVFYRLHVGRDLLHLAGAIGDAIG